MSICVQGNELGGGTLTIYSQELKLPQHASCHRELRPYADLMNWLKIVDNNSFVKLRTVIMSALLILTSCDRWFNAGLTHGVHQKYEFLSLFL